MKSIKHLRALLGWSQTDLANMSGLARSFLSEIESGKKSPTLKSLGAICKAFGIEIWELLYIEHNAKTPIEVAEYLDDLALLEKLGENHASA